MRIGAAVVEDPDALLVLFILLVVFDCVPEMASMAIVCVPVDEGELFLSVAVEVVLTIVGADSLVAEDFFSEAGIIFAALSRPQLM